MELVLLKSDSATYLKAWKFVEEHPMNSGLDNPTVAMNESEAWNYIGSFLQGNKLISEFRHRNHPITNTIVKLSVLADNDFDESEILKRFKL